MHYVNAFHAYLHITGHFARRMNLDPLPASSNSDGDLWHALEISQLKDVVSSLEGGLGTFRRVLTVNLQMSFWSSKKTIRPDAQK